MNANLNRMSPAQPVNPLPEFEPQPELEGPLDAPNLRPEQAQRLLECINDVRQGRKVFLVRATNNKVSNGPARLPDQDYVPDPGLAVNAHEGIMTRAALNKKTGIPYFYMKDGARAPESEEHGHTNISLAGITSFKVLGEFPGPLAPADPQRVTPQQAQMAQAVALQASAVQVQASILQAPVLGIQADALKAQAEQLAQSLNPKP